ncbi:NAD(P)/FAD-dependent oxidoreductase [Sediminibacterium ginsengisoli]|uniref:Glycine/D-amino acid oxidase n=1 Tax=Sediminibacterium ginsengisoli TaxID=413434 RepID=A0A1T4PYY8_9BACT|nr:FAD-dependent oxidoreductase [Sediminibacterium ginsengisoli]SJZ96471.1 Glycine/D-amino acid oxidase [Sediminibacterium ginsengisoli]
MQVDYIVVGQGLCGTFLSYFLVQAGCSVLVIDESRPYSASKVASGVINPVTGRRIVRTWEIEKLMPFAVDTYRRLEKELEVSLIRQCNILDFHPTPQMQLAFAERIPVEKEYLRIPDNSDQWKEYFDYPFSIGEINPCWLIDLHQLLAGWRAKLSQQQSLLEERFSLEYCEITPEKITYKDISASGIFFCDGTEGFDNPYFSMLPYARNKGQAIIAHIPGLPRTNIFKQGISLVPWQEEHFWIGSTYEWNFKDLQPSPEFRQKAEQQLQHWLRLPYTIVDHIASERPANMERRPFAGLHPLMPSVGILNGMGTKGCSLAPYFAAELAQHLVHQAPLTPQVDVRRFTRILSR